MHDTRGNGWVGCVRVGSPGAKPCYKEQADLMQWGDNACEKETIWTLILVDNILLPNLECELGTPWFTTLTGGAPLPGFDDKRSVVSPMKGEEGDMFLVAAKAIEIGQGKTGAGDAEAGSEYMQDRDWVFMDAASIMEDAEWVRV